MAARRGRVAVSITADNSALKKGVKDSEHQLGRLQRVGVSSTRGLSAGFKAAGGIIAGAAVADQIRQTITAAQDAQVAQAKVQTMLHNVGLSWSKYGKHIDEVITKQSRLTGLDDEELAQSFANMVRTTKDVNEALKLNALAADVARTKGMNLAGAQSLIARVYNGSFNGLKKLGIAITPVTTAQDKLKESTKHATIEQTRAAKASDATATRQKALAQLQKQFGGQAVAYGKTAAGAQDRFRVAVENLREKLGAKLLPILTTVTTKVTKFVEQMTDGTGAGGRFADKLKAIADRMRPVVKFFADHPKLIALAIGAWAAYRIAAAAAMAATRLKALGMFKGLARPAAVAGAESGAAFGAASATSAASKLKTFAWAGVGLAIGVAITKALQPQLDGIAQWIANALTGTSPEEIASKNLDSSRGLRDDARKQPAGTSSTYYDPHTKKVVTVKGRHKTPTINLNDVASGKYHKPTAPKRAPHPGTTRAHTSSVRAHAASVGAVAHASGRRSGLFTAPQLAALWVQAGGPKNVADTAAAIALAESGGDPNIVNSIGATGLWQIYNGNGEVPGAKDPMTNARMAVAKYKAAGGFSPWTVYTGADTPGHAKTYTQYLGQSGFTGGASPNVRLPSSVKRPKITTATLEHGQSGVPSPKALGRKRPKATGKLFMQALRPADPQVQAKNMRLFQIGMRRAYILDAIKNGRIKRPEKLQSLAAELKDLDSEQADLLGGDKPTGTAAIPGADAYLSSLDRQAAEAELTPDTADDKSVAQAQLTAAQNIYDYEKTHPGFSDADVADAARNLKTARDAVDQPDAAATALADQMKALTDELKRTNDVNEHILGVTSGQWQKAFADVLNGQIGGFIDSRARTAGDGSLARA